MGVLLDPLLLLTQAFWGASIKIKGAKVIWIRGRFSYNNFKTNSSCEDPFWNFRKYWENKMHEKAMKIWDEICDNECEVCDTEI